MGEECAKEKLRIQKYLDTCGKTITFLTSISLSNDTACRRVLGNVWPGRWLVLHIRSFKGNKRSSYLRYDNPDCM